MSPKRFYSPQGETRERDREDRDGRDKDSGKERLYRKKYCRFCQEKLPDIDYKEARALRPLVTERDKILPRRFTGLCAQHQRQLTSAIKRARILGIVAFTSSQRKTV